ncbi:MAG: hypothetical protein AAFS12_00360 [Cyanobacteria bacterium J06632_19]
MGHGALEYFLISLACPFAFNSFLKKTKQLLWGGHLARPFFICIFNSRNSRSQSLAGTISAALPLEIHSQPGGWEGGMPNGNSQLVLHHANCAGYKLDKKTAVP